MQCRGVRQTALKQELVYQINQHGCLGHHLARWHVGCWGEAKNRLVHMRSGTHLLRAGPTSSTRSINLHRDWRQNGLDIRQSHHPRVTLLPARVFMARSMFVFLPLALMLALHWKRI